MASALDAVGVTIEQQLEDNYSEPTRIAWSHAPSFTPPETGVWIQPTVLWDIGQIITMNPSPQNRVAGVFSVNVFGLPDVGVGEVERACDEVRTIFNRVNLTGVRFEAPSGPQPVVTEEDGVWAGRNISIPFEADETV